MVWQILFVLGLTAGYYRRPLVAWFCRHRSVLAFCTLLAGFAALCVADAGAATAAPTAIAIATTKA